MKFKAPGTSPGAFFCGHLLPLQRIEQTCCRFSSIGGCGYTVSGVPSPRKERSIAAVRPTAHIRLHFCLNRSRTQSSLGQPHRRSYEQALAIEPESAPAYYGLANVLAFQPGRAAAAVAHYEAALRLRPEFAEAHANLANVLAHNPQRLADAIEHYEAALRIDPMLAWVHFNLGLQLAQIPSRSADAVTHYEAALRLKPDDTDALNGLAILYAQAGRFETARTQWQKALAIDPNYRPARENLRRLEQMPAQPR